MCILLVHLSQAGEHFGQYKTFFKNIIYCIWKTVLFSNTHNRNPYEVTTTSLQSMKTKNQLNLTPGGIRTRDLVF
jgi:hypothetical protein